MSTKKLLTSQRQPQKLFKPKFRRDYKPSADYLNKPVDKNITFKNFKNTNIFSTSSYRYGDKVGVVSTQEINIDYDYFVNHTFFHSAVAKVNESFNLILNKFPFDGTNREIESFEDRLTGYEHYVYNIYPRNLGYLIFSGTQVGESQNNGTYIQVEDFAGVENPTIASNKSGKASINPGSKPLNIQMFINIPKQPNDNQPIIQKRQTQAYNYGLYLSESNSAESCDINFLINSGSRSLKTFLTIPKGKFVHITAEYHDCNYYSSIMALEDGSGKSELYATSSKRVCFENIAPTGNLKIGNGEAVRDELSMFQLKQSFSGSMDELRIFHRAIKKDEVKKYAYRSVNGHDDLALYYKFNEPSGSYAGSDLVLDSSRNSLNSNITNYLSNYTRMTSSHAPRPVTMEKMDHSPVLFPTFHKVASLNAALMKDAKDYDDSNPNLITKLIPSHYLELGSIKDGYSKDLGNLDSDFSKRSTIKSNQNTVSSIQLLVKILLSWAKIFDEMKIFIDHFSKLNFVEYNEFETASDKFLRRLGMHLGLELPDIFGSASPDQIFDGYNLKSNPEIGIRTLDELQNMIWRRILSDISNIKKTKGTLDTIRSVFRSSGIEAENIFNFREYGGTKVKSLESSRDIKRDVVSFLNYSGTLGNLNSTDLNHQGRGNSTPFLKSGFLSGSRLEPGKPEITKTKAKGVDIVQFLSTNNGFEFTITVPVAAGGTGLPNVIRLNTGDATGANAASASAAHNRYIGVGIAGLALPLNAANAQIIAGQVITAINSGTTAGRVTVAAGLASGIPGLKASPGSGTDGKVTLTSSEDGLSGNDVTLANVGGTIAKAPLKLSSGAGFAHIGHHLYGPNGISMTPSDGLFTTSSFAIQGYYAFDGKSGHNNEQSLFRMHITGTNSNSSKEGSIINLVANKGLGTLTAYISDGISDSSVSKVTLSPESSKKFNILDGGLWAVSLTKKDGKSVNNYLNDEYFLRAAKFIGGNVQSYYYTSSFVKSKNDSVLSSIDSSGYNTSGSFITIGSQSLDQAGTKFLNNSADDESRSTIFSGEVSYLNFWSSFKDENEFLGYAKNPNSLGAKNPGINYNFVKNESGGFERLRFATHGKQATTSSNSQGRFRFFDFSQNDIHLIGENFEASKIVMNPRNHIYEVLSENFDLNGTKEKIRVRTLQDAELLKNNDFALISPLYETPLLEEAVDDTRFSIDMSAMKGLNENIMTMFPDFQPIENALGGVNSLFAEEYADLRSYRRVYFNNLIEELDLGRYRSIFKWIDNSYTNLIYSLIPKTTNFLGINFVYESHVLERNSFKYLFDEIYLSSLPRDPDRGTLLLSQFVSKICKF